MQKIRIGGVPEHFNYPWHQAIQSGAFLAQGIDLIWKDFPGGTGEMSEALAENEIDLAIMLTEGSVKQICDGLAIRIVQKYVESPLLWGIYVEYKSDAEEISDLQHKTVAISREGSGSHLMAFVNAKNENWNIQQLNFEVANHLNGAVEAIQQQKADYLMWEHFTTKPLVDQKIFKHIDDCPTPWPCFVIVAKNEILQTQFETIQHLLNTINKQTIDNLNNPNLVEEIAKAYQLQTNDVKEWLSKTKWSQEQITSSELEVTIKELQSLNLIEVSNQEFLFKI